MTRRKLARKVTRSVTLGRRLVALKYATTDDGQVLLVPVGWARVRKVRHAQSRQS